MSERIIEFSPCKKHIHMTLGELLDEHSCKQCHIDRLTASLAEAREQLAKYEARLAEFDGCVEMAGSISGAVGVYFSTKEMSKLYGETVGQPVTVWVKRRTE